MTTRARVVAVLAIVLGGAAAIVASTQPWLAVTLRTGASEPLSVAGASAMPLLAPLSLAALALGLALTVVGRALRVAFGVLATLIGGVLLVGAARIAAEHPLDAVAAVVTKATGLSAPTAVAGLVAGIDGTPWPVVAAAAGAVVALGGLFTLATGHRWRSGGRRYRREAAPASAPAGPRPYDSVSDRAIDSWDHLSHGDDPTAR